MERKDKLWAVSVESSSSWTVTPVVANLGQRIPDKTEDNKKK